MVEIRQLPVVPQTNSRLAFLYVDPKIIKCINFSGLS